MLPLVQSKRKNGRTALLATGKIPVLWSGHEERPLQKTFETTPHVRIVLFEADGLGRDFLKPGAWDQPLHFQAVFEGVDGIETIGEIAQSDVQMNKP
jgi:hypothetical protein